MKTHIQNLFITLALSVGLHQASAQNPVITSFSQNGVLVCSGLQTGTVASVEWAASLAGPWLTNWASLTAVAVATNGTIQASVPMFYRVRGVAATNAIPTNTADGMALIPAGTFTMGDTLDGEIDAIPTNVYVSAFYMDTNLVSSSLWQPVYDWATTNAGYHFDNAGGFIMNTKHPITLINWYDCVKWCNARSQKAGLTPVYYLDAAMTQVYTNGRVFPYVNWSANGYRLATEAEWEKSARGGLAGKRFPWGDTISGAQANYYGNTSGYSYDLGPNGWNPLGSNPGSAPNTTPVGAFAPNGYGLYDMAGNVDQWVWDFYGTAYGQPTANNPTGPANGTSKTFRGGTAGTEAKAVRCAQRQGGVVVTSTSNNIGFRSVRIFQ